MLNHEKVYALLDAVKAVAEIHGELTVADFVALLNAKETIATIASDVEDRLADERIQDIDARIRRNGGQP